MDRKATSRVLAALTIFFLLLSACDDKHNSSNKLIGKWEHKELTSGITVVLEFADNKLSFSAEGVVPASTSYTYVDGDTIMVRNPDTGVDIETTYTIQGDKLMIAFSGKDKIEYTRVK